MRGGSQIGVTLPHFEHVGVVAIGHSVSGGFLQSHVIIEHMLQPFPGVLERDFFLTRGITQLHHIHYTLTEFLLLPTQFISLLKLIQLFILDVVLLLEIVNLLMENCYLVFQIFDTDSLFVELMIGSLLPRF